MFGPKRRISGLLSYPGGLILSTSVCYSLGLTALYGRTTLIETAVLHTSKLMLMPTRIRYPRFSPRLTGRHRTDLSDSKLSSPESVLAEILPSSVFISRDTVHEALSRLAFSMALVYPFKITRRERSLPQTA